MRYLIIAVLILISYSLKAQNANLKTETIHVNYVKLPSTPILDKSLQTYSIDIRCSDLVEKAYSTNALKDDIVLQGFEKINDNGSVQIQIQINDVIIEKVEFAKTEEIEKNDEGKVISSKSFYTPIITYKTSAAYKIIDLKGESKLFNLSEGEKLNTSLKYSTLAKAEDYVSNNLTELKNRFYKEIVDLIKSRVSYKINDLYGYKPISTNVDMEVIGAKKHPEFQGHQKNYLKIKELFKTMKYNLPVDVILGETKPVIEYYKSLINKYTDPKKAKEKKIRYASYYNIAQLYYYLDLPDESIVYANSLIENGVSKGKGKRLVEKATELKARLNANKINSRHFEVFTTDITTHNIDEQKNIQIIEPEIIVDNRFVLTDDIEADNALLQKTANMLLDYFVVATAYTSNYPLVIDTIVDENTGRLIENVLLEPDYGKAFTSIKYQYEDNKLTLINISDADVLLSWNNRSLTHIGGEDSSINAAVSYANNGNTIIFKNVKIGYHKVAACELNYIDGEIVNGKLISQTGKLWEEVTFTYDENKITHRHFNEKVDVRSAIESVEKIGDSELKTKHTSIGTGSSREVSFFYREDGKISGIKSHSLPLGVKRDVKRLYKADTLIQTITLEFKKDSLVEKTIDNAVNLPKSSTVVEDYKWRVGKYRFNEKDELVYEARNMKYREKVNGIWSPWQQIRY
ncbi:hypothetical protein [Maribacter forsetii]|uniref:hypothetical protein n=1 Tax=Maribacter forsetii TaxID=444515 RepID=UPI00055B3E95|nr:hypothetical protein [Maribacter forsetii]